MDEGLEPAADPTRVTENDRPRGKRSAEARLLARWREMVRHRPLLAITAAAAVGAALGGLLFTRTGRLAFFAAAGFVANELWHSERRIELSELIADISSPAHASR